MARDTAKKNLRSNNMRLAVFFAVTVASNLIHVVAILLSGEGWWSGLFGISFWSTHQLVALYFLKLKGAASLDEHGDIADCVDISDPANLGMFSYAQDVLWVCWAVQLLSTCISVYFSILYIPIPVLAVSKLWNSVISPILSLRRQHRQEAVGKEQNDDTPKNRLQRRREQARKGK